MPFPKIGSYFERQRFTTQGPKLRFLLGPLSGARLPKITRFKARYFKAQMQTERTCKRFGNAAF